MTVHVVIGPPVGGKSTYVATHAGRDDLVIDHDLLCMALQPHGKMHHAPTHVRLVAAAARREALTAAVRAGCEVWLIHSLPTPAQVTDYHRRGWDVVVVDPGEDEVRRRLATADRSERALPGIDDWYATTRPAATTAPRELSTPTIGASRAW